MKASLKILGIVIALVLLAGIMAYLAGFFEKKIPVDFSGVAPASDTGRAVIVEVTAQPSIEQAAGTLRAKVETVISPLITATISSIAVWAGDEVKAGDALVTLDARESIEYLVSGPASDPGDFYVTSDKPILVTQYMVAAQMVSSSGDQGDPSMVQAVPVEQYLSRLQLPRSGLPGPLQS